MAAVVLVPTLSRVRQRLSDAPSHEAPRFRWTTSCDAVPQKAAPIAVVILVRFVIEPPSTPSYELPTAPIDRLAPRSFSPAGLRAPPSLAI